MKIDKAPFCLGFYLFFSVICGIIRYNEKYARSKKYYTLKKILQKKSVQER